MRTTLRVPTPFSLPAMMNSHGWFHTHPFHPDAERGTLTRIDRIRGRPVRIDIREARRSAKQVTLEAHWDGTQRDRDAVRRTVTTILGLDEDLTAFYAMAKSDPRLRPVLRHGAARTVRAPTLWEDVVKSITQTNIQWKQAIVLINRIVTLGDRHKPSGLHAFPTPARLAAAGPDWLRDHARVGYRAEALIQIAHEVRDGERDLEALAARAPGMDTPSLVKELQTIRGVGPTTARMLAGFLRKHDVLAVDSSTLSYVARHYPDAYRGAKPTPNEAAAVFDRYGEWKGKAWWYEAWLAYHVTGTGSRA